VKNYPKELQAVLEQAREECLRLGHAFVCTEHLLLALTGPAGGEASRFMRRHGFKLTDLRQDARNRVGFGSGAKGGPQPIPSLRALGAIRLAEETAQHLNRPCTAVHLLWAVLQDRDSDAADLVTARGMDLVASSSALEERMGEPTRRRPGAFSLGAGDRPAQLAEQRRWRERLLGIRDYLNGKVIGQADAVERIGNALARSWAGLNDLRRPLASFVMAGPRGSGKTTLAQHLAEFLYQDPDRLIAIYMDEFADESRAWRLVGSAGSAEPGILTSLGLEYPYSVLYFKDCQAAHPRALDILRQILARGVMRDEKGQRVDFRDSVLILQVTLDPELIEKDLPVGFRVSRQTMTRMSRLERTLTPELERLLGSETLELVDDVLLLPPLDLHQLHQLLGEWTRDLSRRLLQRRRVQIEFTPAATALLARRGKDSSEGAGVLQRLFVREVEDRLAQAMLEGRLQEGDSADFDVDGTELTLVVKR